MQISEDFRRLVAEKIEKEGSVEEEDSDGMGSRNCWLMVKHDCVSLFSISLKRKIYEFSYEEVYKTEPYPSSIILHIRRREVDFIKLKTTSSYNIREMLLYFKMYGEMMKKAQEDDNFNESLIELVNEQIRESSFGGSSVKIIEENEEAV